jgi:hypothetical protein
VLVLAVAIAIAVPPARCGRREALDECAAWTCVPNAMPGGDAACACTTKETWVAGETPAPTSAPKKYPAVAKVARVTKRGLCAIIPDSDALPLRKFRKSTWWYNWGVLANGLAPDQFHQEFVPMQWGRWGVDKLQDKLAALVAMGHKPKALLGFNEPNVPEQANMTPELAAELWPGVEAAAAAFGLRLGSPSPAPGSAWPKSDTAWFDEWIAAFRAKNGRDPRFDFLCTHFYACNVDWLRAHITKLKRFGKPIWLTEFACGDKTNAKQLPMMKEFLAYLEAEPAVERYAWFTLRTSGWLGTGAGLYDFDARKPSALGAAYEA